jgi:uncharacterized membrane protein YhaH (DUF805 family)
MRWKMILSEIGRLASFHGRAGRLEYVVTNGLFWLGVSLGCLSAPVTLAKALLSLGLELTAMATTARRLHDLRLSAFAAAAPFIAGALAEKLADARGFQNAEYLFPLVLAASVVCLAAWPGSREDNEFGPPPGLPFRRPIGSAATLPAVPADDEWDDEWDEA